jgi:hypothetical protein
MADKALNIVERIHLELVLLLGQASLQKIQMVLVDDFDYANGWATFSFMLKFVYSLVHRIVLMA